MEVVVLVISLHATVRAEKANVIGLIPGGWYSSIAWLVVLIVSLVLLLVKVA